MPRARPSPTASSAAADLRRRVGLTAWFVMEVLAASPVRGYCDGGGIRRGVDPQRPAVLAMSKSAVHQALVTLQRVIIVGPDERRARNGHFDVRRDVVSRHGDSVVIRANTTVIERIQSPSGPTSPAARGTATPQRFPELEVVEQLVLLLSA